MNPCESITKPWVFVALGSQEHGMFTKNLRCPSPKCQKTKKSLKINTPPPTVNNLNVMLGRIMFLLERFILCPTSYQLVSKEKKRQIYPSQKVSCRLIYFSFAKYRKRRKREIHSCRYLISNNTR